MEEIPKKCKAAVLVEYGKPLEFREYPIPKIEPRGILVKVEMAGLCGSDVHQCSGDNVLKARLPNIPGHETIGRIVKLGEARTQDVSGELLKVGDRITWGHASCGECYWCAIARQPTLCSAKTHYAWHCSDDYPHLMGGFAEYEYVVPRTEVAKIPEELTDEEAIGVGCAFRTIVAAYERLGGIDIQDDVLIQGAGPVGLYALAQAIESGARKTIVVGAPKARLDLAKRWGADYVINIDEVTDPSKRKDQILELTSGRGPDIVVECTGVPAAFSEGVEIIRKGGRYLVIGQVSEATTAFAPSSIVFKSLDIIGTLSATIPHYYKALQFVKNKRAKYPFADIVSNKYSLEQVNEALAAMKAGREMKPVIDNRGR